MKDKKLSLTAKVLIGVFLFWAAIAWAATKDFWSGVFLGAFFVFIAGIIAIIIRAVRKRPVKKLAGVLPASLIAFVISPSLSTNPPQPNAEQEISRELPVIETQTDDTTAFEVSTEITTSAITTTKPQPVTTTEKPTETTTETTTKKKVETTTETTTHKVTTTKAAETTTKKKETTTQIVTKPQPVTEAKTVPTTQAPPPVTQAQTQAPVVTDADIYVYIGKTGNKYHAHNCRTLKGGGTAITLAEAKAQGRTACQICGG